MSTFIPEKPSRLHENIPCQKINQFLYLYRIDLSTFKLLMARDSLYSLLSQEERERAIRISHTKVRERFITGRVMVRILLAQHLQIPEKAIKIKYSSHGKPYQCNKSRVFFNLSHAGNQFVVAVSYNAEVGVDIEIHKDRKSIEGMASEVLSSKELDVFKKLDHFSRQCYFYRQWTLKEASLKAEGIGLTLPINSFGFSEKLIPEDWNPQLGCVSQWKWWYYSDKATSCSIAVKHIKSI